MQVILTNGEDRNVPAYMLEKLIAEQKIVAFLRSEGWVRLDRDPIRRGPPTRWSGARWSDFMSPRSKK